MQNTSNFTDSDLELISIGNQYSNMTEFKKKDLPKYLLAKRRVLLSKIFPTHTCVLPPNYEAPKANMHQGIFYLYRNTELIYIGSSTINCLMDINKSHLPFNNYKIYTIENKSNIHVLTSYLIHLNKPVFNNTELDELTFKIPNIKKLLGKPATGKL